MSEEKLTDSQKVSPYPPSRVCPHCGSVGPFGYLKRMPTPENGMTSSMLTCGDCGFNGKDEAFILRGMPGASQMEFGWTEAIQTTWHERSVQQVDREGKVQRLVSHRVLAEGPAQVSLYSHTYHLNDRVARDGVKDVAGVILDAVHRDRVGNLPKLLRIIADIVEARDGYVAQALVHLAGESPAALEQLSTDLSLAAGYCQFMASLACDAVADKPRSDGVDPDRPFQVNPANWAQATEEMDVILSANGFDEMVRAVCPRDLHFVKS